MRLFASFAVVGRRIRVARRNDLSVVLAAVFFICWTYGLLFTIYGFWLRLVVLIRILVEGGLIAA